jgi:hypothetical protein
MVSLYLLESSRPSYFLLPLLVYYRIFSHSGAVKVKNPESPEDPLLGCTPALNIAPPHDISSLKRHLCDLEDITDHKHANLFKNVFATRPLSGSERLDLTSTSWYGCTPGDPISCVAPDSGPQYKLRALIGSKLLK